MLTCGRYWNHTRDLGKLEESVLFDAETGFGGNGAGRTRCIEDGPFTDIKLHLKDDLSTRGEYCITRNTNPCFFDSGADPAKLDKCFAAKTWDEAWRCLESSGPHSAGHGGVGGLVSVKKRSCRVSSERH